MPILFLMIILVLVLLVLYAYVISYRAIPKIKNKYNQMWLKNLLLTMPIVLFCAELFYLISLLVNSIVNNDAVFHLFSYQGSSENTAEKYSEIFDRYYWVRNYFLILGATIGIISSQVSFIATAIMGKSCLSENIKIEPSENSKKENM